MAGLCRQIVSSFQPSSLLSLCGTFEVSAVNLIIGGSTRCTTTGEEMPSQRLLNMILGIFLIEVVKSRQEGRLC